MELWIDSKSGYGRLNCTMCMLSLVKDKWTDGVITLSKILSAWYMTNTSSHRLWSKPINQLNTAPGNQTTMVVIVTHTVILLKFGGHMKELIVYRNNSPSASTPRQNATTVRTRTTFYLCSIRNRQARLYYCKPSILLNIYTSSWFVQV